MAREILEKSRPEDLENPDRRRFLRYAGATALSMALAGRTREGSASRETKDEESDRIQEVATQFIEYFRGIQRLVEYVSRLASQEERDLTTQEAEIKRTFLASKRSFQQKHGGTWEKALRDSSQFCFDHIRQIMSLSQRVSPGGDLYEQVISSVGGEEDRGNMEQVRAELEVLLGQALQQSKEMNSFLMDGSVYPSYDAVEAVIPPQAREILNIPVLPTHDPFLSIVFAKIHKLQYVIEELIR